VNISGKVDFSLFQTEPVDMEVAPFHHHHPLFCLQENLIQIKGQDIQHSGHKTCLSVIDNQFVCFPDLCLFCNAHHTAAHHHLLSTSLSLSACLLLPTCF